MPACIVMKPGALDLVRHAYKQDCLLLNIGKNTFEWAEKQGWFKSNATNSLLRFVDGLLITKDWTNEILKKAVENEENLKLVIYKSGADIMIPHKLFSIKDDCYIIN